MVPEQLARQAGHRTDQAMGMISGTTSLIGLLGQPVHHSLSPVMQNAALTAMNLDWCYMAMPCETNDLEIPAEAELVLARRRAGRGGRQPARAAASPLLPAGQVLLGPRLPGATQDQWCRSTCNNNGRYTNFT